MCWGASWHLRPLLWAVVGLVARHVAGEANNWSSTGVSSLILLEAVVASSSLSRSHVVVVLVVSSSEASVWWVGAGTVVVLRWVRCCASRLLERAVADLLISPPLLVALAVFPSKSLLLDGNAMVHHMAEHSELASGHHMANPVVQAVVKPELLLLFGVGVVWAVPHHLHEVTLILLHLHGTLRHCAKLLSLLD